MNLDENYSIKIDEILSKLENICNRENSKENNKVSLLSLQFDMKSENGLQYGKEILYKYDDYDQ